MEVKKIDTCYIAVGINPSCLKILYTYLLDPSVVSDYGSDQHVR